MCEATCVLRQLERIRNSLSALSDCVPGTTTRMIARCLDYDLLQVIAQLEAAGEGESWHEPDAALARYHAKRAGLTINDKA